MNLSQIAMRKMDDGDWSEETGPEEAGSIVTMEELEFSQGASLDREKQDRQHLDRQQQIIALYHALRPSLYAYLSTLGLTADEAEDVIQESFLRLMPHRTGGRRKGKHRIGRHRVEDLKEENLRGWLFRVAHNVAMDVHRSNGRMTNEMDQSEGRSVSDMIVDPAPNPEQAYLHKEYRQRVYSTLGQLTEQQRNCIMFRAKGLRYREIASALDISFQRAAELVRLGLLRMTGDI